MWRRTLSLSWPVTAEHVFRTLMRTTDVLVTGLFSPAAVAAIGLADLYARFPLRIGLGLITLGVVANQQQAVPMPSIGSRGGSTLGGRPAMVAVGGVSGLVFGATNVGVQLVAYLRSQDLSHSLFVGVVAMVFVGLNALRIGAAGVLG